MPFTFCHPAVVLPFIKLGANRISATGIIIGSMSPDFEYFLKMRMEKIHGHSFAGLFYFDLPLTIILAFIFHIWVRDAFIQHLPEIIRKRFVGYIGLDWISWVKKYWYVLLYSALIGIFSHVIWDAFTHTNGFFVRRLSFLQGTTMVFDVIIKKADLAQLLSTIFGGMIILLSLVIPTEDKMKHGIFRQKLIYWLGVVLITCITLILRNGDSLGDFIATFIAGGLIGLIVTPIMLKFIPNQRRTEINQ